MAIAILLLLLGKFTAFGEWFNLNNISSVIKSSGPWGLLIFFILFAIGSLIHIPAMLFILVAILIYGPFEGAIWGYLGVVIAMTANYFIVRAFGNKALHDIQNRRLQNMLSKLHEQPLSTIILIRLVFWAAPIVNYTLAMTSVNSRDYIFGSAIGLIIPVAVFAAMVHLFQESIIPMVL